MMRKNFRVRFSPPDPQHRFHAARVLNFTYWVDIDGEYDSEARRQKGNQLLDLLNGDWLSTKIVHHCSAGCCRDNEEAFQKCWRAVRDTVFGERPCVPALNKWTQCFLSACGMRVIQPVEGSMAGRQVCSHKKCRLVFSLGLGLTGVSLFCNL